MAVFSIKQTVRLSRAPPGREAATRYNRSTTFPRTLFRLGFFGIIFALGANVVWLLYLRRSSRSITATINIDHLMKAGRGADVTTLPERSFAPDEAFLLMDYSPWLGFNNMRYMIERALYLAHLLNRTLVLPTQLRIRHCSNEAVCVQTATPLDLGAIGRNEQGSTIALDLGYFFDLPHLADKTHGRIVDFRTFMEKIVGTPRGIPLVDSQFGAQVEFWQHRMRLHQQQETGLPLNITEGYHATNEDEEAFVAAFDGQKVDGSDSAGFVSIKRIQRAKWDLEYREDLSVIDNLVRNGLVDSFYPPTATERASAQHGSDGSFKIRRSFWTFGDVRGGGLDRIVEWSLDFMHRPRDETKESYEATPLLDSSSCRCPIEDPNVEQIPWEARFPAFATCRIENYVGLKQELDPVSARILSVEGQYHTTGWIPIIFASVENAHSYRSMATSTLKYAPPVQEAAEYLMRKLKLIIQSRQSEDQGLDTDAYDRTNSSWLLLSMHVRRGDFITEGYGWQEFGDAWMGSLVKDTVESVFSQHYPSADKQTSGLGIGFYMATDESSPGVIDYFHSLGAILFEDLIDAPFEEQFGHLIVYDDWIGLVEQIICAQAKRFYGTMTSSFTSGIVNLRLSGDPDRQEAAYLLKAGGLVLTGDQEKLGII